MFDEKYTDWNHKRVKAIIDYYGHKFFYGKTILDLGGGLGEIAAQFSRLGADVTVVDARSQNLDAIKKKHPHIKTIQCDLEVDWPNNHNYDIILSLGLLCHLKNYERHLENICIYGEHIILETEVLDSSDENLTVAVYEDKAVNDLSFSGEGTLLTSSNIERRLTSLGAKFKRLDQSKLNSNSYKYDWSELNIGRRNTINRRIWFAKRDKVLAQQFANNRSIKYAEEEARRNAEEAHRTAMMNKRYPQYMKPRNPPPYTSYTPPAPPVHLSPPSTTSVSATPIPTVSPSDFKYFIHTTNTIDIPNVSTTRLFYLEKNVNNSNLQEKINNSKNKNLSNSYFTTILIDDADPTYSFVFSKINEISGTDDINIICTAGIFFDQSISMIQNIQSKQVYALNCWNYKSDNDINFNDRPDVQNTWIIRGKIENVYGDFDINKPSSSSRVAYEFHRAGYKVLNPSKSILTYNTDDSDIIGKSVPGPHLFIIPINFQKDE